MDCLNIQKLQQVNNLAKELKGHGLVSDMTNAYAEATTLTNAQSEMQFLKNVDTVDPVVQQEEEAPFLKVDETSPAEVMELRQTITDQRLRMASMEDVIMKMQHEMNKIYGEINALKSRPAAAPAPQQEAKKEAPAPVKVSPRGCVEVTEQAKNTSNSPNPRQGGYTSADVDIHKIFYSGRK